MSRIHLFFKKTDNNRTIRTIEKIRTILAEPNFIGSDIA